MDLERVGRGKEALNGSKSSSRTKLPFELALQWSKSDKISEPNQLFCNPKEHKLLLTLPSIYKFFFEAQIFRSLKLFDNQCVDIDFNVFPNTWPWTDSKSNPWGQNYGFLHHATKFKLGKITQR